MCTSVIGPVNVGAVRTSGIWRVAPVESMMYLIRHGPVELWIGSVCQYGVCVCCFLFSACSKVNYLLLRIYMMRWLAGLIMVVVILSLGVSRQASRAQPLIRAETQSKLLISHSRATNNSCLGWLHSLWTLKSLFSLYIDTHTHKVSSTTFSYVTKYFTNHYNCTVYHALFSPMSIHRCMWSLN